MIIDCIADLHGFFPKLEGGDLLIVAGDLTARDTQKQIDDFDSWLDKQEYKKKIFIAGNHDNRLIQEKPHKYFISYGDKQREKFEYLRDSCTEFEGLKIWGSPWTKTFTGMNPHCLAFTVDTEDELEEKWKLIPDEIDILITHSPMLHMFDQARDGYTCGSRSLRDHIDRVKPKLHVFGHIHEQGGQQMMYKHSGPNTWCVNASIVNEHYKPVNKPVRITL